MQRSPIKDLIVGPPGVGKTALLAHLANAGYYIHVADFDGGTLPLQQYTEDNVKPHLHITNLQSKMVLDPTTMMPGFSTAPKAYPAFVKMMQKDWDGRVLKEYGLRHIFVIDSLSSFSQAVFHYSVWQNGRSGRRPHPADWGDMGIRLEAHFAQIALAPVNFLILGHFMRMTAGMNLDDSKKDEDNLPKHGDLYQRYPYVVGRSLPPRIGAYFPVILHATRVGEGRSARRLVGTTPVVDVEVKCPLPKGSKLPSDLPAARFPELLAELGGYTVEQIPELADEVIS